MANEHRLTVLAHPNIYMEHPIERQMDIVFTEPEAGVNQNTGMLLLVAGFGENIDSAHFKEARAYLTDKHNMITVQCDYFGQSFMQESQTANYTIITDALRSVFTTEEVDQVYNGDSIDIDSVFRIGIKYPIHMDGNEVMNETVNHFNDMGLMQAIDQLTAMYAVSAIVEENGYEYNRNRIHVCAQGHGAYLAYLCNALAPHLFTCIIDHSAWLVPAYLQAGRKLMGQYGQMTYSITFDYLAAHLPYDKEILHLPSLYKLFRNQARIISYHNEENPFTRLAHKSAFCQSVRLCSLKELPSDGELVQGFDIKQLYDHTIENHSILGEVSVSTVLSSTRLDTKMYKYQVDLSTGMPYLSRSSRT